MKKLCCILLVLLMLFSMSSIVFATNENAVFISYNKGDNKNDGTTAETAKKSLGSTGGSGAMGLLESGGTLVACEKLHIGADYTWKARGAVTVTANYGGTDYKNPVPAANPASGSMKFASGATLTIESDLTLDDLILFQEGAQNTIIVKSGATLTVTEKIVTMSARPYFMKIVVEDGGAAIINGGTFSAIEGDGNIKIGEKVIIRKIETDSPDKPTAGANKVCFIDNANGKNTNSGASAAEAVQGYGSGVVKVLTNGGTLVVSGKSYMAGSKDANEYTLPPLGGPVTVTSVYGGVNYQNPEPKNNPACAFKLGSGTALNISSDIVFDNIILFQENEQNTIHVPQGVTLIITDTVIFMSNHDYHFKIVVDDGAVAILSKEAQKRCTIEGDGDILTYSSDGEISPAPIQTTVKMTINQANAYINDEVHVLDAAPIIKENRTMLPVRFVAEAFGATVGWDEKTSTATISDGKAEIKITIGKGIAIVNGEEVTLDSPAFINSANSRTYMPVRFVAEALGATVNWDEKTSTATLTK